LTLVLDADVVIGALDAADAHHRQARSLFVRWHRDDETRLISVVTMSEVLVAPSADPAALRAARQAIAALGIAVHRPTEAVAVEAARLRAEHPISLPDAYCLATARHARARLVSFDRKLLRAAQAERIASV
jgi:predicted nucleic acid-binding protein